MIAAHPILGVGLGNFKPLMLGYLPQGVSMAEPSIAHNTYIEFAAELGLPGLLLFLCILYFCYRDTGRVAARFKESGQTLLNRVALGIQAGLVAYSVSAFFLSAEYEKLFWLIVFLSACVSALAKSENDKADTRPTRLTSHGLKSVTVEPAGALQSAVQRQSFAQRAAGNAAAAVKRTQIRRTALFGTGRTN